MQLPTTSLLFTFAVSWNTRHVFIVLQQVCSVDLTLFLMCMTEVNYINFHYFWLQIDIVCAQIFLHFFSWSYLVIIFEYDLCSLYPVSVCQIFHHLLPPQWLKYITSIISCNFSLISYISLFYHSHKHAQTFKDFNLMNKNETILISIPHIHSQSLKVILKTLFLLS